MLDDAVARSDTGKTSKQADGPDGTVGVAAHQVASLPHTGCSPGLPGPQNVPAARELRKDRHQARMSREPSTGLTPEAYLDQAEGFDQPGTDHPNPPLPRTFTGEPAVRAATGPESVKYRV